jgi:hypothetical protein
MIQCAKHDFLNPLDVEQRASLSHVNRPDPIYSETKLKILVADNWTWSVPCGNSWERNKAQRYIAWSSREEHRNKFRQNRGTRWAKKKHS